MSTNAGFKEQKKEKEEIVNDSHDDRFQILDDENQSDIASEQAEQIADLQKRIIELQDKKPGNKVCSNSIHGHSFEYLVVLSDRQLGYSACNISFGITDISTNCQTAWNGRNFRIDK